MSMTDRAVHKLPQQSLFLTKSSLVVLVVVGLPAPLSLPGCSVPLWLQPQQCLSDPLKADVYSSQLVRIWTLSICITIYIPCVLIGQTSPLHTNITSTPHHQWITLLSRVERFRGQTIPRQRKVDVRGDIDIKVISTSGKSRRHFHCTSIQVSRESYSVFPPKRDLYPKALWLVKPHVGFFGNSMVNI